MRNDKHKDKSRLEAALDMMHCDDLDGFEDSSGSSEAKDLVEGQSSES